MLPSESLMEYVILDLLPRKQQMVCQNTLFAKKWLESNRPPNSSHDFFLNPYGIRVLGRVARSKNKQQSPPASPSGSSTNVPASRLERRMEAAQSIRTRDNVAHSRVNHHQLLLGNWNILTLTGKELELVEEAKRYHLDIIGVSSTKRRGSGTVDLDGG